MIQKRFHDKEKDIQGLKKQSSLLLNSAWEKGYVSGFDDGYETGRQAEEMQGKWIVASNGITNHYVCSMCGHAGDFQDKFCRECGADMRKEVEND